MNHVSLDISEQIATITLQRPEALCHCGETAAVAFGAAEALEKGLVRSVAHEIETHALNLRGVSADAREGISAFIGKRTPSFANRVPQDVPDVLSALPDPPYRPPNPTDSAS